MNQWDKTLSDIAKKTSDKWGIPTDQGKLLVDTYTSQNLKAMRRKEVVLWVNIGRFYISHVRVIKWILNVFGARLPDSYKRVREDITRDEIKERITKYYEILQIARVHSPRKGAKYIFGIILAKARSEGQDVRHFFRVKNFYADRVLKQRQQ
jgi:hypothetical protein